MKAPLPWPWLSLDGGAGAAGPEWEAPGEGLLPAGCGRGHFAGDPAAGRAPHGPGSAGLGAAGAGRIAGDGDPRPRSTAPARTGSRVSGAAGGGARNRSQPPAPGCPPHRRLDEGPGAGLGGAPGGGVPAERDAVLARRGPGAAAGRALFPLLPRGLPRPRAPCRPGRAEPGAHAAQRAAPGGRRLRPGGARAAAGGRGDREPGRRARREARARAAVVRERGPRRPGAAPARRAGVREHQPPRAGGLPAGQDLLRGRDDGVRAPRRPHPAAAGAMGTLPGSRAWA